MDQTGEDPEGRATRVLALDLGDARIGVAISDPERRLAVPLGTVRTGAPEDLKAVAGLVREHGVGLVVVGLPLTMAGERGVRAHHAERFAEALRAFLAVPVVLHDERLSTVEAEGALRAAGIRGRERRRRVDRSAATVILQSYLDAERARGA
ncbi:MAG TPA: Holliday junction resolvase RuvX [Actinomycetota bacterium]|jgi:putative Holliday junction resolvase|nr:Holliday junction resolvase RuvX [Actinomycetota bacterium]